MLVHISVRNSAGEVHLDKVVNDAEARRVMDKAIEKGAEFTVRHHKAKAPPRLGEADIEAAYAAGHAAALAELQAATTAPSEASAKQSKQ